MVSFLEFISAPKAIFVLGKPNSGKSFFARVIKSKLGFSIIDSDEFLEPLLDEHLPHLKKDLRNLNNEDNTTLKDLRSKAIGMSREKWNKLAHEKTPFIYTGIGGDVRWMGGIIQYYKKLGYDCQIVYITASMDVIKKRNEERERKVDDWVLTKHNESHDHYQESYEDMVGTENVLVIDNNYSPTKESFLQKFEKFLQI